MFSIKAMVDRCKHPKTYVDKATMKNVRSRAMNAIGNVNKRCIFRMSVYQVDPCHGRAQEKIREGCLFASCNIGCLKSVNMLEVKEDSSLDWIGLMDLNLI